MFRLVTTPNFIANAAGETTAKQPTRHVGRARAVVRAHTELTENISDDICLSAVAGRVGLTRSHLAHLFAEFFGMPPMRYRMHVRVGRALLMLMDGLTATEVAFECGFCDQSHLNRWFKRVLGTTPGRCAKDTAFSLAAFATRRAASPARKGNPHGAGERTTRDERSLALRTPASRGRGSKHGTTDNRRGRLARHIPSQAAPNDSIHQLSCSGRLAHGRTLG